ncbi:polyprenyl synthetase family protein [Candidatus Sumerlaeota bacterium]|nr:polyprenyl synthetase family protein [Candidatus Sumerlaeota bacterium]
MAKKSQMPLDRFAARFETVLSRFVADASREAIPNLHDGMAYALGTDIRDPKKRGKRIRPALCLLTADALGAKIERAYPFAVAMELMHNFCLVHDDIEDGDTMRRGRPSVWVKYGLPHAVNIGDYLLIQTHRALTHWGTKKLDGATRFKLLHLMEDTLERTHVGQALDINARRSRSITIEDYMNLVRRKTGFYLAAPIQGGAIVAGADDALIRKIGKMADFLGPMFQIMDDLIDLTQGKGRDAAGSDVREGKRSFMVAFAAQHCTPRDRRRMFDILDLPRRETSQRDVEWLSGLFTRCGAIAAGREQCLLLYQRSLPILESLPLPLGLALGSVFESLTSRKR